MFPPPSQSHLGDLGGTTRPSTAPPAPQVRPIIPIKSHGARPEDSRDPRPHRPLLVSQTLPYSCSQPQSHPSLFFFSSTNSLQPSRCLTQPVSIESPPPPPSHQTHPQRPGWATHWTPPALTSQGSLQSTVSAQDDSEWMRRAPMSCGRRVVHSLVAATLVAHLPQDGGASLPFPPLTLTPGADLRGGESSTTTKRQETQTTTLFCLSLCQTASSVSFSSSSSSSILPAQRSIFYATCCCKCHCLEFQCKSFEMTFSCTTGARGAGQAEAPEGLEGEEGLLQ